MPVGGDVAFVDSIGVVGVGWHLRLGHVDVGEDGCVEHSGQ
jgi:hypothetical protein